jgi:hypothetical protein
VRGDKLMAPKGWTNIDFEKTNEKKLGYRPIDSESTANCCNRCCDCKDCVKRILIIGGITKFKHMYKDLIESCGHKCEYLDGYMKGGDKLLERKIMKCDMVFCPVDCNSHNACVSAKKFCRKHGKPIKILTSSGVTNMAQAIKSI